VWEAASHDTDIDPGQLRAASHGQRRYGPQSRQHPVLCGAYAPSGGRFASPLAPGDDSFSVRIH